MKKIRKRIEQIKIFILYIYYKIYCNFKKVNNEEIWLISERGIDARDNGLYLFEYIRKNYPDIKIKFIITKDSPDYNKVKEIGDVIEFGSKEHYILFVTAGVLISTHLMGFSPDRGLFTKLCKKNLVKVRGKIISLKHGITKDKILALNPKYTKVDLLIAGAKMEYDYMIKEMGFCAENLKNTGFARFDGLISKPMRQILIMPTFRKWIDYINDEEFKKTKYFSCFQSLLNNEKLINVLEENDMKLIFYPHQEFQKYLKLFSTKTSNIILASNKEYDVQKLLIESQLLITDYSSVFFDFAYMRKPVIYYQFDIKEYRENHYKEGYFEYERDGFGNTYYDEEKVVDKIIKYITSNFIIEEEYLNKINNFFTYSDTKNCERIFKEIEKLISKK